MVFLGVTELYALMCLNYNCLPVPRGKIWSNKIDDTPFLDIPLSLSTTLPSELP